jgi:hypothetical protein
MQASSERSGPIESIYIAPGSKLPDVVVKAVCAAKYYGDRVLGGGKGISFELLPNRYIYI